VSPYRREPRQQRVGLSSTTRRESRKLEGTEKHLRRKGKRTETKNQRSEKPPPWEWKHNGRTICLNHYQMGEKPTTQSVPTGLPDRPRYRQSVYQNHVIKLLVGGMSPTPLFGAGVGVRSDKEMDPGKKKIEMKGRWPMTEVRAKGAGQKRMGEEKVCEMNPLTNSLGGKVIRIKPSWGLSFRKGGKGETGTLEVLMLGKPCAR